MRLVNSANGRPAIPAPGDHPSSPIQLERTPIQISTEDPEAHLADIEIWQNSSAGCRKPANPAFAEAPPQAVGGSLAKLGQQSHALGLLSGYRRESTS